MSGLVQNLQCKSIVLAVLAVLAGPAFADSASDLATGYDAYSRGDFTEAAEWFRKAAQKGNVTAQDSLGVMHANGEGVQRDYVLAYMWFEIAKENVPPSDAIWQSRLVEFMADASVHLTPAEIAKAQEMARNWKPD